MGATAEYRWAPHNCAQLSPPATADPSAMDAKKPESVPVSADAKRAEESAASKPASKVCCFCNGDAGAYGNNPAPIKAYPLVCCDSCNMKIVIPARFGRHAAASRT